MILLGGSGLWNLLRYGLALATGRLSQLSDVRIVPGREVRIEGADRGAVRAPVQVDGDIGARLPVTVSIHPIPVTVLAP